MADNKGGWLAAAQALLPVATNLISGGGPKRQFKYNKKLAEEQSRLNRENAEWAFQKELELRKYQADYDLPKNQMQRYADAGLNPNLIYGQGSPGHFEPPAAPTVPGVNMGSVDAHVLGNIGTQIQQARLMAAQTDLTKVKTEESSTKQDLMRAQEALTKANPYMKKEYVESMVLNLKSVAEMKAQESSFMLSKTLPGTEPDGRWERGYLKMQTELGLLEQKFKLGQADQQIKGKIIESKEFENALKQVQARWMQDADITPQHIYQGIFMLLQSLMR